MALPCSAAAVLMNGAAQTAQTHRDGKIIVALPQSSSLNRMLDVEPDIRAMEMSERGDRVGIPQFLFFPHHAGQLAPGRSIDIVADNHPQLPSIHSYTPQCIPNKLPDAEQIRRLLPGKFMDRRTIARMYGWIDAAVDRQ